jgi:hypothetical protein
MLEILGQSSTNLIVKKFYSQLVVLIFISQLWAQAFQSGLSRNGVSGLLYSALD